MTKMRSTLLLVRHSALVGGMAGQNPQSRGACCLLPSSATYMHICQPANFAQLVSCMVGHLGHLATHPGAWQLVASGAGAVPLPEPLGLVRVSLLPARGAQVWGLHWRWRSTQPAPNGMRWRGWHQTPCMPVSARGQAHMQQAQVRWLALALDREGEGL